MCEGRVERSAGLGSVLQFRVVVGENVDNNVRNHGVAWNPDSPHHGSETNQSSGTWHCILDVTRGQRGAAGHNCRITGKPRRNSFGGDCRDTGDAEATAERNAPVCRKGRGRCETTVLVPVFGDGLQNGCGSDAQKAKKRVATEETAVEATAPVMGTGEVTRPRDPEQVGCDAKCQRGFVSRYEHDER